MKDRTPHYRRGRKRGWRWQCNGKKLEWAPVWVAREPEPCPECACSCQSEAPAPIDTAIPEFHFGPTVKLRGWKECCVACGEEWLDLGETLKRVYTADAFFWPHHLDESWFFDSLVGE
jgi:hypothetical protein